MQNENEQLQQQIREIIHENSCINSKLETLKSAKINNLAETTKGDSKDDAARREKLTDDAFKNVKKQIDYLQRENNDLRSFNKTCQTTIENLQKEIENYRNQLYNPTSACEVKQKYTTAITLLESTILNQKSELKEQAQNIKHLLEQKKKLQDQIEHLQKSIEDKNKEIAKYADTTETIAKLQEQLTETVRHNKELQKSLKTSRQAIEDRIKREQIALQKVQEALTIAETAVADKEEALKREKVVKEECDNIASTIGQVMDEAARKVEKDMEAIRKKYTDKEKALTEEMNKLTEEVQNQKKFNQILDTRCKRFQQKFEDAMKDNENLLQQLESATQALLTMEENLNKIESIKNNEAILQKRSDEQEIKIRQFMETNKQLQNKYHKTISDFAKKFEKEVFRLENEVSKLKAENDALKSQNYYEMKE